MNKESSINPELVKLWSDELSEKEPYEYPFKASYKTNDKQLYFIASLHSNNIDSETFKIIQNTILNEKIDLILLEGFPYSKGVSPVGMATWANPQGANGLYDGFEIAFTIKLAAKREIPFIGGEPDQSHVFCEVQKKGFTKEDLIFYHFVQQVFQQKMNGTLERKEPLDVFQNFIQTRKKFITGDTPTFEEFKKWYLLKNKEVFSLNGINEQTPAPYPNGKLYTQKVSSAELLIRDQFIVKKIDDSLKKYDSVLVIYGGSHWSTQRYALEGTFGAPIFSK